MYRINYIILIGLLIICSCKIQQEQVVIKQVPSNTSILLLRDIMKNEINGLYVYYDFEVYKTCLSTIEIVPLQLYLGYYGVNDMGEVKYILENNKIYKFDYSNPMRQIYYRKPRIYRIKTWQQIDSESYIRGNEFRPKAYSYSEQKEFLQPYLDSMNKLGIGVLRIGSVAEVLHTNPKFFNYFIKGDTILINFIKTPKGFIFKRIPIELK